MRRNFWPDDAPPSLADLPHVKPQPDNRKHGFKPDKFHDGFDAGLATWFICGLGCYAVLAWLIFRAFTQAVGGSQ